ncbi:MAG: zinc ribbon domain-containing protein [Candidatus Heimdallarchaeota archaeon]|nr:zinc ribbon domain-containing protein [Candidatus Heimdallarchaeota archaeon]
MLTLNRAASKVKNHKDKLPYYGLVLASSLKLLWSIILTVIYLNEGNLNYVAIFSVGIAITIITGVLAIICTIRIRSELPDLDFFQLKEVKEGKIAHPESESAVQPITYYPIVSKPDKIFCVNCGERIKVDAQFCGFCGVKIERE